VAGRWVAGQVTALAVPPCVLRWALTSVAADLVDAHAAVSAEWRVGVALIDVLFARFSREERCAAADEEGLSGGAMPTVGTRI